MGLNYIIELYNLGENAEILSEIDNIGDPDVEIQAIKSLTLTRLGRTKEANDLAVKLQDRISNSDQRTKYIVLCAEIRSIATYGKSDWVKARELIEEAEELYGNLTVKQQMQLSIWYPEVLWDKADVRMMGDGNPKAAILMLIECETIFEKIGNIRDLGFVRAQLAYNNFLAGDIGGTLKALENSISYAERFNLNLLKIYTFGFQCEIFNLIGRTLDAIIAGENAKKLSNSLKYNYTMVSIWARRNLGIAYSSNGEYDTARNEYIDVLEIANDIEDLHIYGSTLYYIADLERKVGDLDIAIERFQHSVDILEKIQDLNCLINVNLRLGKAFMSKNDYIKAIEPLKKAFHFRGWKEENGNQVPLSLNSYSETLLELIVASNEINNNEDTNKYLAHLESFAVTYKNEKFSFQLDLAKALIEMQKRRAKYKIQAQNRLEVLVYSDLRDDELQIRAIINYCELLLEELHNYGEEEVLNEIIDLSQKIFEIGERQKSHPLKVEGLILEGQLRLIQGEAQTSMDKFNEAKDMAEKFRLPKYREKALLHLRFLESEIEKWEVMYHKNVSLIDRMEKTKILDYVSEAIKMRDFLPE